jgi:hypothetical protein
MHEKKTPGVSKNLWGLALSTLNGRLCYNIAMMVESDPLESESVL